MSMRRTLIIKLKFVKEALATILIKRNYVLEIGK
jgi:hypothetical protein